MLLILQPVKASFVVPTEGFSPADVVAYTKQIGLSLDALSPAAALCIVFSPAGRKNDTQGVENDWRAKVLTE